MKNNLFISRSPKSHGKRGDKNVIRKVIKAKIREQCIKECKKAANERQPTLMKHNIFKDSVQMICQKHENI